MTKTPKALTTWLGENGLATLEQTVREAEQKTSAELAVFVRGATFLRAAVGIPVPHERVREVAERLFVKKGLQQTKERNAVMVYFTAKEHALVVLGDEGIHQRLGSEVWQQLIDEALALARASNVLNGLCLLIQHLGEKLGEHFPRSPEDKNELPDVPDVR